MVSDQRFQGDGGGGAAALTIDECVEDELAVLLDQVVDVPKDSAVRRSARRSGGRRTIASRTHHMVAGAAQRMQAESCGVMTSAPQGRCVGV